MPKVSRSGKQSGPGVTDEPGCFRYQRIEESERALPATLFARTATPSEVAFLAGRCFKIFRRRGGARCSPFPDFHIGAHAAVAGMRLLTRDATMRPMNRRIASTCNGAALATLLLGSLGVVGCYSQATYAPRQGLAKNDSALILAGQFAAVRPGPGPGSVRLDVYDFESACPDLAYRLTARGYRGSVTLGAPGAQSIVVPGFQPVILKSTWSDGHARCDSVVVFRPRSATTYQYRYAPPSPAEPGCGALIERMTYVDRDDGSREQDADEHGKADATRMVAVRHVRPVDIRVGLWGVEPIGDLCALAEIAADAPDRSIPVARRQTSDVSPTTDGSGTPPVAGPGNDDQGVARVAPAPIAAANPAPEPPPQPSRYRSKRCQRISGHSLGFRFGGAGGGDTCSSHA